MTDADRQEGDVQSARARLERELERAFAEDPPVTTADIESTEAPAVVSRETSPGKSASSPRKKKGAKRGARAAARAATAEEEVTGTRTIGIVNQKGGVGKTTTAVNLAACLAVAERRTLLIDLDPQGNATSGVGARRESRTEPAGLLSAALEGRSAAPLIEETQIEGLLVIGSSDELSRLELIQGVQGRALESLGQQLRQAAQDSEFVLVDCPPSLGGLPTIALSVSDAVLVPIQCEYYAMEGLSQILPVIKKIQETVNSDLEILGFLLTMFSEELDLSQDVVREVQDYFPALVFRTIVPRDVVLAEASSHGLPAFEYAPLSRGAWSYIELAKEVLAHERS